MAKLRGTIRKRTLAVEGQGTYTYHVADLGDIDGSGRRHTKQFKTRAAAKDYRKLKSEEIDQHGKQAFNLSDSERVDSVEALAILQGKTFDNVPNFPANTLSAAAHYYVEHTRPTGGTRTVNEAFKEFIALKMRLKRRSATLQGYRDLLNPFLVEHGDKPLTEITSQHVEQWLMDRRDKSGKGPASPAAQDTYLRHISALLTYCENKHYVSSNVSKSVETASGDKQGVTHWTPDQVRAVLSAAARYEPSMVPYMALSMFSGLRPTEIRGTKGKDPKPPLEWSQVNFKKNEIRSMAEQGKMRKTRRVEISDNLREWLIQWPVKEGRIFYSKDRLANVCSLAKVEYHKNVMRHTFGTWHYWSCKNEGLTAVQMGNSIQMVKRYYVETDVENHQPALFWNIRPTTKPEALRIHKAG